MEFRYYLEKVNLRFEDSFSMAAGIAAEIGCKEECLFASKRALSYNPNNSQVLALFPSRRQVVNDIKNAIEESGAKLQTEEDKYPFWRRLGVYYLVLGDFPNSFAAFAHTIKSCDLNDLDFIYAAAVVYSHYHYYEIGSSFFQQILTSNANPTCARDVTFRLAIISRNVENFSLSTDLFKSLFGNPPDNLTKNDVLLQYAYNMSFTNQKEESLMIYKELQADNPDNIHLIQQYLIALLLYSPVNEWPAIQTKTLQSIQHFGFDPTLALINARISTRIETLNIAFEKCKICLTYYSDSPYFWISLGILYFQNKQNEDAISAFQHALFLRCDLPEPWLNIGLIYEVIGDTNNAGKMYQTGYQRCPKCKEFAERLGEKKSNGRRMMMDISDEKYFVQIPEKFANDYISAVPCLPSSLFPPSIPKEDLDVFSTLPKSLFA